LLLAFRLLRNKLLNLGFDVHETKLREKNELVFSIRKSKLILVILSKN